MSIKNLEKKAEDAKISDLSVLDFMSKHVISLVDGTKIFTAIQTLSTHQISGAPVVDSRGRLLGIISEYDLLLQAATKDLSSAMTYSTEVLTLSAEATLREVLVLLYKNKYRRLPVVDQNKKVLGVVSRIDVLNRLIQRPIR